MYQMKACRITVPNYRFYPFADAIRNKDIPRIRFFMRLMTKSLNDEALILAARYGYTDIVELLLPVSDPKAHNSDALRMAALQGHTEIVKLLIPLSNPKAFNLLALRNIAEYSGYTEIVNLLMNLQ